VAVLLKANGASETVSPASGPAFTLSELQAFVGGYIEIVRAPFVLIDTQEQTWLVLNEDGKREQLAVNYKATALYHQAGGARDDRIVGDVLLATHTEVGGGDDGTDDE
jgi:hypothetical protein